MKIQMLLSLILKGMLSLWILIFIRCGSGEKLSGDGSGTQTGNPSIVGFAVDSMGDPVPKAEVKLRRSDYLSPIAAIPSKKGTDKANGTTDVNGYFSFDSVDSGEYTIEISRGSRISVAVTSSFNGTDSLNLDTLPLSLNGVLKGFVPEYLRTDSNYYIQILGLERVSAVDPASGYFAFEDLPAGIYDLRMAVSDADSAAALITNVEAQSGEERLVSFFEEWQHSARISIEMDLLNLPSGEAVYNFPLLVRLSEENFDFSEARPEGEDIRFIASDNKELEYEVEFWDSTTSLGIIWVKMDSLSPIQNNELYMLWGNPQGKSGENSQAVFDTSNGFAAVWHMGQSGGDEMPDATFNNYTGIPTGMDGSSDVIGAIGRSQVFEGASTWISVANSADGDLNLSYPQNYSLSAWVYLDSIQATYQSILSKGTESFGLYVNASGGWEYTEFFGEGFSDTLVSPAQEKQWVYVSVSRRDSLLELYVNGVKLSQKTTSANEIIKDNSLDLTIGAATNGGSLWFEGKLDEIRMSKTFRTPNWFLLCYETQKIGQSVVAIEKLK